MQKKASWFYSKARVATLLLALLTILYVASAWAQESGEPSAFDKANATIGAVLFFDIAFGSIQIDEVDRDGNPVLDASGNPKTKVVSVPFLVVVLVLGAIFFTFWYRWINVRGLKHSINIIQGKYDNPEDTGEISHFRALTSALSATVGLGNIAGVAIAIQLGGPGAVFWMLVAAVFGMTAKFSSCTLSQMYRQTNRDGSISGGPMYYVDIGLKQPGRRLGTSGQGVSDHVCTDDHGRRHRCRKHVSGKSDSRGVSEYLRTFSRRQLDHRYCNSNFGRGGDYRWD